MSVGCEVISKEGFGHVPRGSCGDDPVRTAANETFHSLNSRSHPTVRRPSASPTPFESHREPSSWLAPLHNEKAPRGGALNMAERVGFEPTVRHNRTPDFESGAIDHSTTSPDAAFSRRRDYSVSNRIRPVCICFHSAANMWGASQ